MPGVKDLRKIQIGAEDTAAKGTPVAATAILRHTGTGEDMREKVFPEEDVGLLSPPARQYEVSLLGGITVEGDASFEQLPYTFEAGIDTGTPAQDGAGTGYIYAYVTATTAQNAPRTYTIEAGDDQGAEEMAYCYVEEFGISGEAGGVLSVSTNWRGQEWDTSTYTASLELPTVEEILFQTGRLYIDDTGNAPGTTQISNSFIGMDLTHTTGFQHQHTGDGSKTFSFIKQVGSEVVVDVTFEHDANAIVEKEAWRDGTQRVIRFDFTGSALGTTGTTYGEKKFFVDMLGYWETFSALDEQDGNDIYTGTFRARWGYAADTTDPLYVEYTVVNELTALT